MPVGDAPIPRPAPVRHSAGRPLTPALHVAERGMLGLPVQLESDAPELLAAALRACDPWSDAAVPAGARRLRLGLVPDAMAGAANGLIRVEGRRLTLLAPGAEGGADADTGEAWCRLAPALLADPARLAEEILDPLLLFMLTRSGRIPLHAAGFLLGGRAVLLYGPGGSGKSSLALEAARAGLPVLGDDTVFLEMARGLRIWGFPRVFHLPLSAAGTGAAPTPVDATAMRLRGGRWKLRVEPRGLVSGPVEGGILCILAAGERAAIEPLRPEDAVAAVMASLEPGFDHFRDVLPDALRRLAAPGCWRLTLEEAPATGFAVLRAALTAPGR